MRPCRRQCGEETKVQDRIMNQKTNSQNKKVKVPQKNVSCFEIFIKIIFVGQVGKTRLICARACNQKVLCTFKAHALSKDKKYLLLQVKV